MLDEELAAIELHADLWAKLAGQPPRIFDVGANEGHVACRYREMFPGCDLHAFEPNPYLSAKLEALRFPVHVVALGATDGTVEFNLTADNRTSSVLRAEGWLEAVSPGYTVTETLAVPMVTLDSVVKEVGAPDILKIDAEGYDLEVLLGGRRLFRDLPPAIVSCEVRFAAGYVGQALCHEIAAFLDGYGYRLHSFTRLEPSSRGYLYFGEATWIAGSAWQQLGYPDTESPTSR